MGYEARQNEMDMRAATIKINIAFHLMQFGSPEAKGLVEPWLLKLGMFEENIIEPATEMPKDVQNL
jgi:hypothetical protein